MSLFGGIPARKSSGRKNSMMLGLMAASVLLSAVPIALMSTAGAGPAPLPEPASTANAPHEQRAGIRADVAKSVKQGEVLKVYLPAPHPNGPNQTPPGYVSLAGRKAPFFQQQDGRLQALVAVSIYQKPGTYPLSIYDANHKLLQSTDIRIDDGRYKTQNVSVSKSTAGLQPLPGEMEAIQALKMNETPIRYWEDTFLSPTIDCQNSPFGVKRFHNGKSTGDYHKGVDLRSPQGRPIRATATGKVQIARMYRLHGGTVGLDHGQGIGSVYIHMSKINVQPGAMVKKGDVLGQVGSTGFATGPHLHWGLYVNGLPVNPNQWIANVPSCQ